MSIQPSDIKPKIKGASDKFSWRLYCWLRKNGRYGSKIYRITYESNPENPYIYIGHLDRFMTGSRVNSIRYGNPKIWANVVRNTDIVEDITEQFWKEYLRIGVCSLDNLSHQWDEKTLTRKCVTCGAEQSRKTKVIRQHYWVAAA